MTHTLKENVVLSLLVAYRGRPLHLKCLMEWFNVTCSINPGIELVIMEDSPEPSITTEPGRNIKYFHIDGGENFNKARLLNIGFNNSSGKLISSYDVDLVPADLSFRQHLAMAGKSPDLLISGYRLNYKKEYMHIEEIDNAKYSTAIDIGDCTESFLRRQLIDGHRFAVIPLFSRERIEQIGAWDERFEGWGSEDMDFLDRYLGRNIFQVRAPDLLYMHLNHGAAQGWNDPALTQRNDSLYFAKRELRKMANYSE